MKIVVTGSLAYDHILDFPETFADHIMPDKLHVLSVSFLADNLAKNYGGTAGNIAYTLGLLGNEVTVAQLRQGIEGAEILSGNDYEIALIQKNLNLDRTVLSKLVKVLIMTLGEQGSIIYTGSRNLCS